MTFEQAIDHVTDKEGGFTKDPDDSGNWTSGVIGKGILKGTKKRISAGSYPDLDIEKLTDAEIYTIYRRDFWNAVKAEYLPPQIRLHVLDFAVNAGQQTARVLLQKIVELKQDGIFGPATLNAASKTTPWQYAQGRIDHYNAVVIKYPVKRKYFYGWMKRNLAVTELCFKS
ncbi:N-acetylmuramidase [Dyadobacter sp. CY345]|uniref:glycoside hydrolase family 108 protein n=1 Tax=Dyadobacter sp. CY345 TaxID=2909335 RepID=UPI001F2E633F|nr:N-acetylmuramidase [Dyadobacter sp. CY345]MCF2443662.1 N-acetylmuramidase [Dyadobacter sp. CY345]